MGLTNETYPRRETKVCADEVAKVNGNLSNVISASFIRGSHRLTFPVEKDYKSRQHVFWLGVI